jgi:hypothetical protein
LRPDYLIVMVPPPLISTKEAQCPLGLVPRVVLLGTAVGLVTVFATAFWLDPYEPDGRPRQTDTHVQLGLPPCSFRILTGVPCPACGLTTSFSLLVHGNVTGSFRANAAGAVLAAFCLLVIPWATACGFLGRKLWVRSIERTLLGAGIFLLVALLARWVLVLSL